MGEAAFCYRAGWIASLPEGRQPWTVEALEGWLMHEFATDLQAAKLRRIGRVKEEEIENVTENIVNEVLGKDDCKFEQRMKRLSRSIKDANECMESRKSWNERSFKEGVKSMLQEAAPRTAYTAKNYRMKALFFTERDTGRRYIRDTELRLGGIPDIVAAYNGMLFPVEVTSRVTEGKKWQNTTYWLVVHRNVEKAANRLGLQQSHMATFHKIATYKEPGKDDVNSDESTYGVLIDMANLSLLVKELYASAARGEEPDARKAFWGADGAYNPVVRDIIDFNVRMNTPGWIPRREKYRRAKCTSCYRAETCEKLDKAGR